MGCSSLAISAEHACRALPLMFMVQEPHTSSRQAASHAGGVVLRPSAVTGLRWICISTEMTLELGRRSTLNSSQRDGWPGPSARSMRTATLASVIVARRGREDRVLEAFYLLQLDARALRRRASDAVHV